MKNLFNIINVMRLKYVNIHGLCIWDLSDMSAISRHCYNKKIKNYNF